MSRVVVINHLTLDGVMQAPGRADEDTRDGFAHGGWSPPYGDDEMGAAMGARMVESGGLLFGRRTYEDLLSYWNTQDSPFKDALGSGRRLFADGTASVSLRLVGEATTTTTGVVIVTYQPPPDDGTRAANNPGA